MINESLDTLVVPDRRATERANETPLDPLRAWQRPERDHCPAIVICPWGFYATVDSGERFCVKRITVNPGTTLPAELHLHRAEHWVIVRGSARAVIGETTVFLTENQSAYIPAGMQHRLENPGKIPLQIVEVQSGSYFAADDTIRVEGGFALCDNSAHDG